MKILLLNITITALTISTLPVNASSSAINEYGEFSGEPKTQWSEYGRTMILLEDFSLILKKTGKKWKAPKGAQIDGASIPKPVWSFIGSPFVGKYRNASIIHDYYCETKSEDWENVHEMFYYGCLAGGVPETQAKLLYAAVYGFGPRWDKNSKTEYPAMDANEARFNEVMRWIEENDPSLERISNILENNHIISAQGEGEIRAGGSKFSERKMAEREAKVRAMRDLAERLSTVIDSKTILDGVRRGDSVEARSKVLLKGARTVEMKTLDNVVTVRVEVLIPRSSTVTE